MSVVAVTGARGPLGRRVCHLVAADPTVTRLLRMDEVPTTDATELKGVLDGVDALVLLGPSTGPELDGTGTSGVDVETTRAVLDTAGAMGVSTVVVLSTAMVYGAWPDNPVPLTEDAPLRPLPDLTMAVRKAEVEQLVEAWRPEHPDTPVAVLRPCLAVGEDTTSWMGSSLWQTGAVQFGGSDPPAQFVHLDDLAAAVDLARRQRLDGAFNVAPHGWIPADQLRLLAPPTSRIRLPGRWAARLATLRWSLGLTPTPPEVLPYTVHPWVVANDRLCAQGWVPRLTNEEAFVAGVKAGPLATLTPRRRQHLALGAVATLCVTVVVLAVVALRRWIRLPGPPPSTEPAWPRKWRPHRRARRGSALPPLARAGGPAPPTHPWTLPRSRRRSG